MWVCVELPIQRYWTPFFEATPLFDTMVTVYGETGADNNNNNNSNNNNNNYNNNNKGSLNNDLHCHAI